MALFRSIAAPEPAALIAGEGVLLRAPRPSDFEEWAALRQASRAFLVPWEPVWPADDLTRAAFRRRLRRYAAEMRADQAYPFFVVRRADHVLMGGITLSSVRRGVSQAATLGYWMGERHAGRGHMTAAVRALVPFAFDTLRLNRVEAACLPHNAASMRLLGKAGFRQEGLARRYLCINGVWQDHVLFALVRGDPLP